MKKKLKFWFIKPKTAITFKFVHHSDELLNAVCKVINTVEVCAAIIFLSGQVYQVTSVSTSSESFQNTGGRMV